MSAEQIEQMKRVAYGCFAFGAFITAANIHLSFVRPVICRLRRRECRFISGVPVFGSLLLVVSFFMLPSGHVLRPLALLVAMFDTGGIHWFIGTLVYFWWQRRRKVGKGAGHDAA